MLSAFRVRNLRCISDSNFLEIRPIVVFVGRNSSGKSTLLRLFPLIKQSVSEDTREPILWFGRSADFGSFDEAVNRASKEKEITFEFRFTMSRTSGTEMVFGEGDERIVLHSAHESGFFVGDKPTIIDLALTVARRLDSEGTYTRTVEARIGTDVLRLSANEDGQLEPPTFNGVALNNVPVLRFRFSRGRFFPTLVPVQPPSAPEDARTQFGMLSEGPYFEPLVEHLRPFVHGNTQRSSIVKLAGRMLFGSQTQFNEHFSALARTPKSKLRQERIDSAFVHEVEELRALVFLRHLPRIFREASSQLSDLGSGVRYLEPVRARASRYYRFQELAIDEIDPQGENVPMFLSSLSYYDQASLDKWMTEAMGFQVRANKEGGHAKLVIREKGNDRETNLADTGFGYSQVLPIILQLWKIQRDARQTRRRTRQQVVAVEQPELHLHPHYQALLADIFSVAVKTSKESTSPLSLVIETHSEHLVNRLGALVEKGVLSKEDIIIYLVERDERSGAAVVKGTAFSEAGTLSDPWPFGFFSPQLP